MPLLVYKQWERFDDALDRAKAPCQNSGKQITDHVLHAQQMIHLGKGAVREVVEYHLSRFGAYLVAMNGDPREPEIAAAQQYFAVSKPLPSHHPAGYFGRLTEGERLVALAAAGQALLDPAAHRLHRSGDRRRPLALGGKGPSRGTDPAVDGGGLSAGWPGRGRAGGPQGLSLGSRRGHTICVVTAKKCAKIAEMPTQPGAASFLAGTRSRVVGNTSRAASRV
jgi:hypothetical protein